MANRLQEALHRETYKMLVFPHLLHYREQSSSWLWIAEQLNAENIPTYSGRAWTRQNVERLFKSYWRERNGRYSWNEHKAQIAAMEAALGVEPLAQEEAAA
jgi:hypothetical protein